MSIAAGYLGDGFSVVATDTRTTNIAVKEKFNDEAKKLFLTKFGWVAESGGVALSTTFFNNLLNSNNIKTRKQIYTCWLMAIRETVRFAEKHADPKLYSEISQEVNSSQAICSINYFKDNAPEMEVDTIDFVYGRRELKAINSLIVNPPKPTIRTKRLIAKYSAIAKEITNVHEAIYTIACFMDDLSKISKWVSNIVDCGISLKISDDEIIFLRVTEAAKDIKQLYIERQDLSEIMMFSGNKVMEGSYGKD